MSLFSDEEMPFVKKVNSVVIDALNNNKITLFKFLNKREIEILNYLKKDSYLYVSSCLGDYQRAIISGFEINPDFKIVLVKINYNKKYLSLNHRIVLGTIMSLGVSRNTIGDIFITESDDVYFYATREIYNYLKQELRIISHQSVELEEKEEILGNIKNNYKEIKCFVASLRLDIIISELFNLSRSNAQELISNSNCKVNQRIITNKSYQVKEKDEISLMHYGKGSLLEIGGKSKNNRIFITLAKKI